MKAIESTINSYYQKEIFSFSSMKITKRKEWECYGGTISKVRTSEGFPISNYRILVEGIADVTLWNREYEMFYRGQHKDYKDKNGKTVIYPRICRPERNPDGIYKTRIQSKTIEYRYNNILDFINLTKNKEKYLDEYYFALIQHYELMSTPLIDITQSLKVAATFALRNSDTGYLYVFGLPYPNGSISHFIDQKIVLVKLQNVCPTRALRPRYQEGFMVGKYPFKPTKEAGDNLARRLVAKYFLKNVKGAFWDKDFQPLPEDILYPKKDWFEDELKRKMTTWTGEKRL